MRRLVAPLPYCPAAMLPTPIVAIDNRCIIRVVCNIVRFTSSIIYFLPRSPLRTDGLDDTGSKEVSSAVSSERQQRPTHEVTTKAKLKAMIQTKTTAYKKIEATAQRSSPRCQFAELGDDPYQEANGPSNAATQKDATGYFSVPWIAFGWALDGLAVEVEADSPREYD
jgi:hypothetical protein